MKSITEPNKTRYAVAIPALLIFVFFMFSWETPNVLDRLPTAAFGGAMWETGVAFFLMVCILIGRRLLKEEDSSTPKIDGSFLGALLLMALLYIVIQYKNTKEIRTISTCV